MKKAKPTTYREYDRKFKLKRHYIVRATRKSGDLVFPVPKDIVKAFHIEVGDVAVFEVIGRKKFLIVFVKRAMCSFVEPL